MLQASTDKLEVTWLHKTKTNPESWDPPFSLTCCSRCDSFCWSPQGRGSGCSIKNYVGLKQNQNLKNKKSRHRLCHSGLRGHTQFKHSRVFPVPANTNCNFYSGHKDKSTVWHFQLQYTDPCSLPLCPFLYNTRPSVAIADWIQHTAALSHTSPCNRVKCINLIRGLNITVIRITSFGFPRELVSSNGSSICVCDARFHLIMENLIELHGRISDLNAENVSDIRVPQTFMNPELLLNLRSVISLIFR